ncbi:MAG: DUF6438 domain-containing protein [Tenacibaculum sp.]
MKYFSLFIIFLVTTCNSPKKETSNTEEKPTMLEEKNTQPTNELFVVFKNPKSIQDDKALLKNSGLTLSKMACDKETLKIGVVQVPEGKRDFWLERLQLTNAFKLVDVNNKETITKLIKKEENTLISITKTPCFGDCAVYDVAIDKEGNVSFNGIQYVLKEGNHSFKLSNKELKKLTKLLNQGNIDEFKDTYDNPRITDLPSTFITYKGKQIQIRLWNGIPDELINVHEYVEGLLLDQKLFE